MDVKNINKLQCIAVDDEPFALKIIEDFCSKIPSVELLHCFNNSVEAYDYLQSNKPDVVFLDIRMPHISGLKLAETLKELPFVIFTTAYAEYAVKSYNLDAIDYLLKPFDFDRFYKAVQKAQKHHALIKSEGQSTGKEEFIVVKIEYNNVKININEILYLESLDNYVKIHLNNKYFLPHLSLKALLTKLPEDLFIRIHKSFAVAKNRIDFFNRKQVTLGDVNIPIGRTYLPGFMEKMKNGK